MSEKHYAEVLIDGKVYTLGGAEETQYLQRVANYISEKTAQLKKQPGFTKQSQEYQAVMVELNIADDYFKAVDRAAIDEKKREEMERESYSLKHELVMAQMKLESTEQELLETRERLEALQSELLKLKAMHAADRANEQKNHGSHGNHDSHRGGEQG